jgi:hypothetical protein
MAGGELGLAGGAPDTWRGILTDVPMTTSPRTPGATVSSAASSATLEVAVQELRQMRDDGVVLDSDGGTADDYAHLVTTNPDVARKYDMHDESEFFGEDEDEGDDGAA